jgi:Spy/CpxP family protein refolding chaperone
MQRLFQMPFKSWRYRMRFALAVMAMILVLSPAFGQTQGVQHSHAHQHGAPQASGGQHIPYAGMQQRQIKALSQQQIDDLRAGRGMGLALAAELNNYPGPMHVLELADTLGLTPTQRRTMETLIATMRRDALVAGEALIAAERDLNSLFASGQADDASVAAQMKKVSHAQGEIRLIHLRAHIPTRASLTTDQVMHYARLRGYAAN